MKEIEALSMALRIFAQFLSDAPSQTTWQSMKEQEILKEWFIHSNSDLHLKGVSLWLQAHERESYEAVASDFTRLFLCDEVSLKAPPYASFYLDQSGEMYTRESDTVLALYKQFSFHTKLLQTEPADHGAIELEFLALLVQNYERDGAFEPVLKAFLSTHVAPWIYAHARDIQSNANSAFYQGLGCLLPVCIDALMHTFTLQAEPRKIYKTAS
ncbi:TorD/DmsD family molecular chaperone [Sulfurospirillum barnesii]|uniref:Putative component of anaerobic dehydrogenase n=1 Tax=Sulfurospirillum barnesii (strain ATCC 700032 / DSM 10660 / SES-3) TaxID=760154 RepID=I3XW74_SULBS|nr:molecular chaperone TorD family protein [Sulfurospirillum barnesii]AFL68198.1 putative component of anaerobic dehydrogenase [Sulfurospirillum barnesii SES-3]